MMHSSKHRTFSILRDPKFYAIAALALALPLWVGSVLFADTVERFFATKRTEAFHAVLRGDLAYVEAQARQAAESDPLELAIARRDRERALVILDAEMRRRNLGTMVAVDRDGIALARVPAIGSYGDYVSETQPWGRDAARGDVSVMIGKGRTYPLVMIAAAPVMDGAQVRGAVYAGYRLDSTYAGSLVDRVGHEIEVVFYSMDNGMIGSSVTDPERIRLLEGSLNVGSDWVRHGLPEAWIDLGGTRYFVKNIQFVDPDGVDRTIGGALVLVPIPWKLEVVFPAFLVALALACIAATILPATDRRSPFRHMMIGAIFLYAFLTLVFAGAARIDRRTISVTPAPYVIYNSTVHLIPVRMSLISAPSSGLRSYSIPGARRSMPSKSWCDLIRTKFASKSC
ncbi:MAG TPA: cache domain-containing protein [Candidatus Paceibacterota bacterium]|nr:cache domain-containing protein [Candidatus Paceibacterota bacterium]